MSDAPEFPPMAIDSERHGGLWDVPETALAGASRGRDAAHAAVAQHPWGLATEASYAGLVLVCLLAAVRLFTSRRPPWAAYAGSQPHGPERR